MPNWVYTNLIVSGPKESLADFLSKIKVEKDQWGNEIYKLLDSLYPMPEEYEGTVSGSNPVFAPEHIIEKWKAKTWYDWQHRYWGIKWGDCDTELTDRHDTELVFQTTFPWSYPEPAMLKISADFPDLEFTLDMEEEGGFFYGEVTYQNGQVVKDEVKEGPSPRQIESEKEYIREELQPYLAEELLDKVIEDEELRDKLFGLVREVQHEEKASSAD